MKLLLTRLWNDNTRQDHKKSFGGGKWIDLDQRRNMWGAVVNVAMNFRVPKNEGM